MFIVVAARWAWRKAKKAILLLFGGSEAGSVTQEKTDEGTEPTSARQRKDSSSWERAKGKARHAWIFLKALIDAILFPEEVKMAYLKIQAFFAWVKQSWAHLRFLLCHPKILAAKAQTWMYSLWKAVSTWFAKGLAFMTSPSGIAIAAVILLAFLLFKTMGHRGPWA